MFDGFSGQARQAMQLAYRAAHRFQHDYVGADHMLLGVVREGSEDVSRILASFEVNRDVILGELEDAMEHGETPVSSEQLPLTPLAKQVLKRARKELRILYHEHLGPVHLLLALLHANQGLAVDVLQQFGMDYVSVWQFVQTQTPPINRDHMVQSKEESDYRIFRDPSGAELQEELTEEPLPDEMTFAAPQEPSRTHRLEWDAPIYTSADTLFRQLRYTQHVLGMALGFMGGYLGYGLQGAMIGVVTVIVLLRVQNSVVSLITGFVGGFLVGYLHTGDPLWTIIGALTGMLVCGCFGNLWTSQRSTENKEHN